MLKHSRVSGTVDTSRLGKALARPGMDTRTWVSLAIIKSVHVDAAEGVFCDVLLMPARRQVTARLGTGYAGNGFGFYTPVTVDDEVLVEAPNGDPDQGLVVTQRLHSASDPPPQDVVDNPEDVLLHIQAGKSIRIVTEGEGDVIIDARGSGVVKLGDEDATRGVARIHDAVAVTTTGAVALQAMLDARYAIANPSSSLGGATIGEVSSASSKVKSA